MRVNGVACHPRLEGFARKFWRIRDRPWGFLFLTASLAAANLTEHRGPGNVIVLQPLNSDPFAHTARGQCETASAPCSQPTEHLRLVGWLFFCGIGVGRYEAWHEAR